MSFIQYEVWGSFSGHETLIETVATLKEAQKIIESEQVLYDELWIIRDEDGSETVEVERHVGL
jgi:hypothetical protein